MICGSGNAVAGRPSLEELLLRLQNERAGHDVRASAPPTHVPPQGPAPPAAAAQPANHLLLSHNIHPANRNGNEDRTGTMIIPHPAAAAATSEWHAYVSQLSAHVSEYGTSNPAHLLQCHLAAPQLPPQPQPPCSAMEGTHRPLPDASVLGGPSHGGGSRHPSVAAPGVHQAARPNTNANSRGPRRTIDATSVLLAAAELRKRERTAKAVAAARNVRASEEASATSTGAGSGQGSGSTAAQGVREAATHECVAIAPKTDAASSMNTNTNSTINTNMSINAAVGYNAAGATGANRVKPTNANPLGNQSDAAPASTPNKFAQMVLDGSVRPSASVTSMGNGAATNNSNSNAKGNVNSSVSAPTTLPTNPANREFLKMAKAAGTLLGFHHTSTTAGGGKSEGSKNNAEGSISSKEGRTDTGTPARRARSESSSDTYVVSPDNGHVGQPPVATGTPEGAVAAGTVTGTSGTITKSNAAESGTIAALQAELAAARARVQTLQEENEVLLRRERERHGMGNGDIANNAEASAAPSEAKRLLQMAREEFKWAETERKSREAAAAAAMVLVSAKQSTNGSGEGGKITKQKRTKKQPAKKTAYNIFFKHHASALRSPSTDKQPPIEFKDISRVVGKAWMELPAEEKERYEQLANVANNAVRAARDDKKIVNGTAESEDAVTSTLLGAANHRKGSDSEGPKEKNSDEQVEVDADSTGKENSASDAHGNTSSQKKRMQKLCLVPGCSKQSQGLNSHGGMCQAHYTEMKGVLGGDVNANTGPSDIHETSLDKNWKEDISLVVSTTNEITVDLCPEKKVSSNGNDNDDVSLVVSTTKKSNLGMSLMLNDSTLNDNAEEASIEEHYEEEKWGVRERLGANSTKICSHSSCGQWAVAVWHDLLNPGRKPWNSCLECQKKDFDVDRDGWPYMDVEEDADSNSGPSEDHIEDNGATVDIGANTSTDISDNDDGDRINIDDVGEKLTRSQKRQLQALMAGEDVAPTASGTDKPTKRRKTVGRVSTRKPSRKPRGSTSNNGPKEVYSKPAPEYGEGWTVVGIARGSGETRGRIDEYWFSPQTKKKFRSHVKIISFLVALDEANGDEDKAWSMIKK